MVVYPEKTVIFLSIREFPVLLDALSAKREYYFLKAKSLNNISCNFKSYYIAYANKKIEELDTRRQTISKAIAELSVETISPQQIKKLSYYLDNWDSIDFDDKRKAADGLISTIKATSDRVQIEWKI